MSETQRRGAWLATLSKQISLVILVLFLLALPPMAVGARPTAIAHADAPFGHDNTTNPAHAAAWTHGDPNTGDAPGFGAANDGYYYLKIRAAGHAVWCELYTGGAWRVQLMTSNKRVLAQLTTVNTGGRVFITDATVGALYLCRISNIGRLPLDDYAELNSGDPGNRTTSDCGGPGPVWDVNFDEPPMEPAPTPGMPVNGCASPTTVPYAVGDPRLLPPPEQSTDLGFIHAGAVYPFTAARVCHLTVSDFFGHQGQPATLAITNRAGQIVNGPKWGAQTPNPDTMRQEYVGADAGVVPPGTYVIHFTGPTNTKDLWAICV